MRTIATIGQLREAIKDLRDDDELVIEIHEGFRSEDLYVPTIDIIENIEVQGGKFISEVRLCI